MNILKLSLAAAALAAALPNTAAAQEMPLVPGDYVEMSGVRIDDGHDYDYATYLAGPYRKQLDFAVSKGYLKSYEILLNDYPREGEPTVYLIQRFERMPTLAEQQQRSREYYEFMQRSAQQLDAESGERAKYRTVISEQLLRKLDFRD